MEFRDPGVYRVVLGRRLADARVAAGLSQRTVAAERECALSKLNRIEGGKVSISRSDLEALLQRYGLEGEIELLSEYARKGRQPSWWHRYKEICPESWRAFLAAESAAEQVYVYHPSVLPFYSQVSEYTEQLLKWRFTDQKISPVLLGFFDERQQRLADGSVDRHIFIDELVLRRPIGGAEVMRRQITHLLQLLVTPDVHLYLIPPVAHPFLRGCITYFPIAELSGEDFAAGGELWDDSFSYLSPTYADEITKGFEYLKNIAYPLERARIILRDFSAHYAA